MLKFIGFEGYFEGFDIVTLFAGSNTECSPLSCNEMAGKIKTNQHCLIESFEQAKQCLEDGFFQNSELGPYRIFAVYSFTQPSIVERWHTLKACLVR